MTMTYDDAPSGVRWLKITDYAEHTGKGRRTITRMISEGRLPEARQDPTDGVWYIPADAKPLPAKGIAERERARERNLEAGNVVMLGTPPTLPVVREAAVETVPTRPGGVLPLATLEEVAEALGTTVGGVRRLGKDGHLNVGPYGPRGALRVYWPRANG